MKKPGPPPGGGGKPMMMMMQQGSAKGSSKGSVYGAAGGAPGKTSVYYGKGAKQMMQQVLSPRTTALQMQQQQMQQQQMQQQQQLMSPRSTAAMQMQQPPKVSTMSAGGMQRGTVAPSEAYYGSVYGGNRGSGAGSMGSRGKGSSLSRDQRFFIGDEEDEEYESDLWCYGKTGAFWKKLITFWCICFFLLLAFIICMAHPMIGCRIGGCCEAGECCGATPPGQAP
ncbi:unnamed protein product [Amoebophrya sp. A120]|nr:unnamed protein product [Amoebophrya sp. A120]|eukprot:GSA120T00023486001.1